jgi:SAM-dependent methyltransferase
LCKRDDSISIKLKQKPLTKGQFGYEIHPVICKCGLVYLNPRWDGATYSKFYKSYYDELYRLDEREDYGIEGIKKHTEEIFNRISQFMSTSQLRNIIDVGCGSGAGFLYLKEALSNVNYYGVEASEDSILSLNDMGVKVVDSDIEGAWTERYKDSFDLLIMRHVLEHVLNPVDALKKISKTLSSNGVAYIAVPDMMHPRVELRDYDNWWEYYFRSVHPYYYSKETLFFLLNKCGLNVLNFGEENEEIWCIVSKKTVKQESVERVNNYNQQLEILKKYLP